MWNSITDITGIDEYMYVCMTVSLPSDVPKCLTWKFESEYLHIYFNTVDKNITTTNVFRTQFVRRKIILARKGPLSPQI
jgi:hypothetical protein